MTYFTILSNLADIHAGAREARPLPVNDKRYLLADLPDGTPNPNTHAYGHNELATEVRVQMEMSDQSGTELVLEQQQPPTNDEPYYTSLQVVKRELQFKRRHDLVAKTLAKRGRRDSNGEEFGGDEFDQVHDGDENRKLVGAQFRQAERAAAARPGPATRIGDFIERICARDNLRMPDSPPKRMPPRSPQKAGNSFNGLMSEILYYLIRNVFAGLSGANLPCTGAGPRRIVYSSDEKTDLPPRPPPFGYRPPLSDDSDSDDHWPARTLTVRNRRTRRNSFFEAEAGIDGDASADEDDDDGADLDKFIVADDVY